LVLDRDDSSFCSPVNGFWSIRSVEEGWLDLGNVEWGSKSEHGFVLLISPCGHEVVSDGESVLWVSVDFDVLGLLGKEDGLSELEFFVGGEVESVLGNVLEEHW